MAATEDRAWEDEVERWGTAELGSALTQLGRQSSAAECRWLRVLAEFDRRQGWALDGQLSGRDWLVWRCGLSARTSRDKLRVAHELRRRPAVAAAFAEGSLTYCKVRAITRITDADAETDEWLIRVAHAARWPTWIGSCAAGSRWRSRNEASTTTWLASIAARSPLRAPTTG